MRKCRVRFSPWAQHGWPGPAASVPDPEDARGAPAETSLRPPALASAGVAHLVDRVRCTQGPPRFSRGLSAPTESQSPLDSAVQSESGLLSGERQGLWALVADAGHRLPCRLAWREGAVRSCVRWKPWVQGGRHTTPRWVCSPPGMGGVSWELHLRAYKLAYSRPVSSLFFLAFICAFGCMRS